MKIKLTDEQVEQAISAGYRAIDGHRSLVAEMLASDRKYTRATAPYLQAPWEMPTEAEVGRLHNNYDGCVSSARAVLTHFVTTRNAALQPKPVDPAVAAVNAILNNPHTAATRAEALVAAVREADAKAKKL